MCVGGGGGLSLLSLIYLFISSFFLSFSFFLFLANGLILDKTSQRVIKTH